MGLSVFYDFRLPLTASAGDVHALLARWREFVKGLGVGKASPVLAVAHDDVSATQTIFRRDPEKQMQWHYQVPVTEGWKFVLHPKARCETLSIALCRYPEWIDIEGQRIRSRFGGAWRYHHWCKTQYADVASWDPFLAVHRAVIDCLAQGREYGVRVRIRDEGGYWPRRDERTLRLRLDGMHGHVAALAGVVKDALEESGAKGALGAPILDHPDFERLELAGMDSVPPVAKIVKAIRDLGKPTQDS